MQERCLEYALQPLWLIVNTRLFLCVLSRVLHNLVRGMASPYQCLGVSMTYFLFQILRYPIEGFTVMAAISEVGQTSKIYSECMGKIVVLMLDNLRKVDILQFL